ncbi:hypothetical protein ACFQZ4_01465 [Catellatospora coxensis]
MESSSGRGRSAPTGPEGVAGMSAEQRLHTSMVSIDVPNGHPVGAASWPRRTWSAPPHT